jgi:hypothetical protein
VRDVEPQIDVAVRNWNTLLATIGDRPSRAQLDRLLTPLAWHVGEMGLGGDGSYVACYRLDDYLEVECYFSRDGRALNAPNVTRAGKWLRNLDGSLRYIARNQADEDFVLGGQK